MSEYGWRDAFRYPPLVIAIMGVAFYLLARDLPLDVGLPDYVEEDLMSARAESLGREYLRGLDP